MKSIVGLKDTLLETFGSFLVYDFVWKERRCTLYGIDLIYKKNGTLDEKNTMIYLKYADGDRGVYTLSDIKDK